MKGIFMKRIAFMLITVMLISIIVGCKKDADTLNIISASDSGDLYDSHELSQCCDSDSHVDSFSGAITYSSSLGFNSIREMKIALEDDLLNEAEKNVFSIYNNKEILDCDTLNLYELKGLDSDYQEKSVEWCGKNDYSITYTNTDELNYISFMPFNTVEELEICMKNDLRDNGTYDSLKNNKRVSNIRISTVDTKYGEKTIYTYDTRVMNDRVNTYIKYYNENNDTTYIIVEVFSTKKFDHTMIFAFNDVSPFVCYCFENSISIDEAINLYSSKVID